MGKIAVLGGGQIGEALVSGLVAAGVEPAEITVTNRRAERSAYLARTYGVRTTSDNRQAAAGVDFLFLAVKPAGILRLLEEVRPTAPTVVISLASGVSLDSLEAAAPHGVPVLRAMPNTPMLLGAGMTTLAAGAAASERNVAEVCELLRNVGEVAVIAEKDMDVATALQGSAPAYFFFMAEALVDAGVQLGLTRAVAHQLVAYTAAGSGRMLTESGSDAAQLRANVTSPGGTTAAAIRELEESGLRGAFYRAVEACADRAKELG